VQGAKLCKFEDVKETPVYFLDTLLNEVINYIGIDEVKQRLVN
jgi:hypothetical protein